MTEQARKLCGFRSWELSQLKFNSKDPTFIAAIDEVFALRNSGAPHRVSTAKWGV